MKKDAKKIFSALLSLAVITSGVNIPAGYSVSAAVSESVSFDMKNAPEMKIEYRDGKLDLSWSKVKGAEAYLLYYYDAVYRDFVLLNITDKTSVTDLDTEIIPKMNGAMLFKVCAKGSMNGKSALGEYSDVICVYVGNGDAEIRQITPEEFELVKDEYEGDDRDDDDMAIDGSDYYAGAGIADDYEDDYDGYEEIEEEYEAYDDDDEYEEEEEPDGEGFGDNSDRYDSPYYYAGDDDIKAGTLTAGEIRDNIARTEFEKAMHVDWKENVSVWKISPEGRYRLHVTADGKNAENCTAELLDSEGDVMFAAKTNNKGIAYLFTGTTAAKKNEAVTLRVSSADGKSVTEKALKGEKSNIEIEFKEKCRKVKNLDIMLMVDTTGSMSDELSYIQAELKDVVTRASKDNEKADTRVSVNFYRDETDLYTLLPFDFTSDIDRAVHDIGEQSAIGGGDAPEAVLLALDNAINHHDWREDSTKLLFIVLDAPPHNYESVIYTWNDIIAEAARKGIRIIPVTASSTDNETEYLMRTSAVITGGTYIFITDDSGVGLSHKTPSASSRTKIEKLNDLMVRVIEEYIS